MVATKCPTQCNHGSISCSTYEIRHAGFNTKTAMDCHSLEDINKVSQNAPYATDDVEHHEKLEGWKEQKKQDESRELTLNVDAMKAMEDLRAAKYKEVENRIKQHIQMMKERKKLTGIPQEDMQRANQDFKTAEQLEEELADMRKDLHKEYRFTAFTGDLLPPPEKSASTSKPQNIFSNMTF